MSSVFPSNGVTATNASGAAQNLDTSAGCTPLFYPPRCNPRLSPEAMNTMISEVVGAVNCVGREWDCSRLDNLCLALQDVRNSLFECLTQNFPTSTNACSIEQLVMTTDASGCRRIARYTAASARLATSDASSDYPAGGPTAKPDDPTDPATFYSNQQLLAAQNSGTINEAILADNILTHTQFTLACDSLVEFCFTTPVRFEPQANGGNGRSSDIVMRIDGVFQNNGTTISTLASVTNFQAATNSCVRAFLPAGTHTVALYVVRSAQSTQPAQVNVGWTVPTAIPADLTVSIAQS